MILILIALTLGPVVAIIMFIYFKDKYEKEPLGLLLFSFFLGMLSTLPAIGLELLGEAFGFKESSNLLQTAIYAFIVVGFSEEFSKFIFLRWVIFPNKEFNEPYDGIVYAVMISMGFAAVENVMYVMKGGMHVALLRAFTAVPAHAVFAVIMGYYVGAAKFTFRASRIKYLVIGLLAATLFHGAYDFFLFQQLHGLLAILAFIVLILGIILSFKAIKVNQRLSPFRDHQKSKL